jgi:hypothetical protein
MSWLGLGVGLSGGGYGNAAAGYFGAALLLGADSDHVTTSAGNLVSASDQSGHGNTLTMSGSNAAPYTASGGVKSRPFVTFNASLCTLGMAANLISAGADRTVYHVFQAISTTVDMVTFKSAAPDLSIRFSSGLGTTSDEATYNNTGTYTFDTTTVHILEVQYHIGAVSTYILDGVTITQSGASVSTSDTGTAGFQINGGAASGGHIWYATYVVSKVTSAGDDSFMLGFLQGKY